MIKYTYLTFVKYNPWNLESVENEIIKNVIKRDCTKRLINFSTSYLKRLESKLNFHKKKFKSISKKKKLINKMKVNINYNQDMQLRNISYLKAK